MGKTTCIIQARMGSTRLAGKVMKDLYGKTVLQHVIERVKQSRTIDDIIIATTTEQRDDVLVEETQKCGIMVFRGSEADVLSRYYYAAEKNHAEVVIRITSDCPLIDPKIIDRVVTFYQQHSYDIVTNASGDLSQRTFPRGLDTEVFSFAKLKEAFECAREQYQREHVTPYIYENSHVNIYKNDVNYSNHRWTLDTPEDFELIERIYGYLYKGKHDFYMEEILDVFEMRPELIQINAHIEQKRIKLDDERT